MTAMGQPYGPILNGRRPWFQSIAAPPAKDGKLPGRRVVKVNGQWIEVTFPTTTVR
jgi:hypothetical protein